MAERRAEEAVVIRRLRAPRDSSDRRQKGGSQRTRLAQSLRNGGILTDDFTDRFEVQGRTVTRASWWIDQRDTDPADLEKLLADASSDVAATVTENAH